MQTDNFIKNIIAHDMHILQGVSLVVKASTGVTVVMLIAKAAGVDMSLAACLLPVGLVWLVATATVFYLAKRSISRGD